MKETIKYLVKDLINFQSPVFCNWNGTFARYNVGNYEIELFIPSEREDKFLVRLMAQQTHESLFDEYVDFDNTDFVKLRSELIKYGSEFTNDAIDEIYRCFTHDKDSFDSMLDEPTKEQLS